MKEKRKSAPRKPFLWLMPLLAFIIGGYFPSPLALNAFTNWWADDPFMPRCDIPEYSLAVNYSNSDTSLLYEISPDANPQTLEYVYIPRFVSPNGRWLRDEDNGKGQIIDRLTNQAVFTYEARRSWDVIWLYDNRLIYKDESTAQSRVYDPQNNSLEVLGLSSYFLPFPPNSGDNYFLTTGHIFAVNERREGLILYDHALNPHVLVSFPLAPAEEASFWGTLSPDGRYLAYELYISTGPSDLPRTRALWLIDFQQENPQPIYIADVRGVEIVWSPNSTYFAYSFYNGDDFDLYFYNTQSQEIAYSYDGTLESIRIIEWNSNGFWLEEEAELGAKTLLFWGNFDGINMEAQLVFEGGRVINTLNSSDNLMIFIWQEDGNFNDSLRILSPDNGFIFRGQDSLEGLPTESPDNRYLLYHRNNDWLYILDFETQQICRAAQLDKNRSDRVILEYYWYAPPQS